MTHCTAHQTEIYCQCFVSDIAIFVLKRDVKLQLTNYCQCLSLLRAPFLVNDTRLLPKLLLIFMPLMLLLWDKIRWGQCFDAVDWLTCGSFSLQKSAVVTPPQRFSLGDLLEVGVPPQMASETITACIWDGVLIVCFMAELFQRSHSRRLNISLLCVQWSVRSTVADVYERISTCVHSTACTYWSRVRLWLAVTRVLYIISVNFVGCCFVDSWLCQIW